MVFGVIYASLERGRTESAVGVGLLLIAVALTLVILPRHLRHRWLGMRARRPPRGGATLLGLPG